MLLALQLSVTKLSDKKQQTPPSSQTQQNKFKMTQQNNNNDNTAAVARRGAHNLPSHAVQDLKVWLSSPKHLANPC